MLVSFEKEKKHTDIMTTFKKPLPDEIFG